jgi:hypothetical protein
MAMANTLAYYYASTIMIVKCFIVRAPRANVLKLFTAVRHNLKKNNLECLSLASLSRIV